MSRKVNINRLYSSLKKDALTKIDNVLEDALKNAVVALADSYGKQGNSELKTSRPRTRSNSYDATEAKKQVLQTLQNEGGWLSVSTIAEHCGFEKRNCAKMLADLVSEGSIFATGKNRGRRYSFTRNK